nr:unnamed protein product [Digitaria exilis]
MAWSSSRQRRLKHVAACHCVVQSGCLLEDLYGAVVPVADAVRGLYDKDVMAGISYEEFRHMMFFDACFLVQYMLTECGIGIDPSLHGFLRPNRMDIDHDILLLENQLPWQVLEAVMEFSPVPLEHFINFSGWMGCLQDRKLPRKERPTVKWEQDYKPPHLLGLVRFYIVGTRDSGEPDPIIPKTKRRSASESAIGLAKIGITLTANKTMKLIDVSLQPQDGTLFAKLSLAPLAFDRDRASYLVNMAAHELCTVESFSQAPGEQDSAVCSYLMLLAMLVYREEDVHELRDRGLLEGGGGLTNEEALRFFSNLQGLRLGKCYSRVMQEIESYKEIRRVKTRLHAFFYNYWKIILTFGTVIGSLVGIIVPLLSLKGTF